MTLLFTVNRRDAGYSELDVTVTSPLGRHLPIEVKGTPDGDGELIEFTPTVPGKYRIAITYGGIEVPGEAHLAHHCSDKDFKYMSMILFFL